MSFLRTLHRCGRSRSRQFNKLGVAYPASVSRAQFSVDATTTDDANVKQIPSSAKVVICGGGVIGNSVAYHLAERGWTDVVLLEQGK